MPFPKNSRLKPYTETFRRTCACRCLLARGVPALGGPVGSRAIRSDEPIHNANMDDMKTNSSWPRRSEIKFNGWRHSDVKTIALPFVRTLFDRICTAREEPE